MQLYAIYGGGELKHYPRVTFNGKGDLPSQGALSNPDDAPLVKDIENKMIDAFGHAIVEIKLVQAGGVGVGEGATENTKRTRHHRPTDMSNFSCPS